MKDLLLDQGLPYSTALYLKQEGITASHASDLGLSQATDADILVYAEQHNLVLVTLDADFHLLLATSGAASPSVIRLRLQGKNGRQLAVIIAGVLEQTRESLKAGAVVSVGSTLVRVKLLPLKKRPEPAA